MPHPLDNPVYTALTGPHAPFAEVRGQARRYPPQMSPFLGLPEQADAGTWRDARALVADGRMCAIVRADTFVIPADWESKATIALVQLVRDGGAPGPACVEGAGRGRGRAGDQRSIRPLAPADVPAMLALAREVQPGPFNDRTIAFGGYLGVYDDGVLVAMAGHRMRAEGWTEISAVSTAAMHRGQGLATRLVCALIAEITERGDRPFLHAAADNPGAIRLYEALGFEIRRHLTVTVLAPVR